MDFYPLLVIGVIAACRRVGESCPVDSLNMAWSRGHSLSAIFV